MSQQTDNLTLTRQPGHPSTADNRRERTRTSAHAMSGIPAAAQSGRYPYASTSA